MQEYSNESDATAGISLHISPIKRTTRANLVRFVRIKRANFIPLDETRFMVCSGHFFADSFQHAYHIKGVLRRLMLRAVPTVWKAISKLSKEEFTPRQRRKVSKYTLVLSVFIHQVNLFNFFVLHLIARYC